MTAERCSARARSRSMHAGQGGRLRRPAGVRRVSGAGRQAGQFGLRGTRADPWGQLREEDQRVLQPPATPRRVAGGASWRVFGVLGEIGKTPRYPLGTMRGVFQIGEVPQERASTCHPPPSGASGVGSMPVAGDPLGPRRAPPASARRAARLEYSVLPRRGTFQNIADIPAEYSCLGALEGFRSGEGGPDRAVRSGHEPVGRLLSSWQPCGSARRPSPALRGLALLPECLGERLSE